VCGKVLPEGFALELQHTIRVLATRWVLQQVERSDPAGVTPAGKEEDSDGIRSRVLSEGIGIARTVG
jgi:hypothetical protein